MTRNIIIAAFVFAIGVVFSSMAYFGATKMQNVMAGIEPAAGEENTTTQNSANNEIVIGGDFTMIDENGNNVTAQDYKDTYKLVFFGFTHCPDICPAGMQKIALTMDKLGDTAQQITPLFVSVDPRRDLPDVMKEYTAMFDERIIGLTGNEKQVQDMEDKFKVYASKIASDQGEEFYMYAHSAYIYLTDKNNHMITVFGQDDIPQTIAKEIKHHIQNESHTQ